MAVQPHEPPAGQEKVRVGLVMARVRSRRFGRRGLDDLPIIGEGSLNGEALEREPGERWPKVTAMTLIINVAHLNAR